MSQRPRVLGRAYAGFPVLYVVVGTSSAAPRYVERSFELVLERGASNDDSTWQGIGIGERLVAHCSDSRGSARREGCPETIRWSDPQRPSHQAFYGRDASEVADELAVADVRRLLTMRRSLGAARPGSSSA